MNAFQKINSRLFWGVLLILIGLATSTWNLERRLRGLQPVIQIIAPQPGNYKLLLDEHNKHNKEQPYKSMNLFKLYRRDNHNIRDLEGGDYEIKIYEDGTWEVIPCA